MRNEADIFNSYFFKIISSFAKLCVIFSSLLFSAFLLMGVMFMFINDCDLTSFNWFILNRGVEAIIAGLTKKINLLYKIKLKLINKNCYILKCLTKTIYTLQKY